MKSVQDRSDVYGRRSLPRAIEGEKGRLIRTIGLLVVVLALVNSGIAPVEARSKRPSQLRPIERTYHLSYENSEGCEGEGYLLLEARVTPDPCTLYSPGERDSRSFVGTGGLPMVLDTGHPISLDVGLACTTNLAAEYEAIVSTAIGKKDAVIASAKDTLMAPLPGRHSLRFDLDPDKALKGTRITNLNLTLTSTSGLTYCEIDFESFPQMVIGGFR